MKDYLMQLGLPIFTSLMAYVTSRHRSKSEMRKQKELNNTELQKIKEQCVNEIEKIKIQMDKQAELYEKNAQTDIIKDFMGNAINNPYEAMDKIKGMAELINTAQQFQNKFPNTNKKRKTGK